MATLEARSVVGLEGAEKKGGGGGGRGGPDAGLVRLLGDDISDHCDQEQVLPALSLIGLDLY